MHQMQIKHTNSIMASKIVVVVFVSALVCLASADDVQKKSDRSEFKKSFSKNCDDSYSLTCLKLDVVSWVDKLSENGDISVVPGISIVRENTSAKVNTGDIVTELAREFPDDPNARLDAFLMKKVHGFLNNHSIKLNLWNAAQSQDSAGTARKKDKKGDGGMGMLLAAGAMMKGMLMALAMGGIAALAGKALMTGLISLLLSAIIGLKSLGGGGGGHSTYEVVAKPVYTSSHSHSTGHEGWDGGYGGHGRSFGDAPLPLALQPGYKPPQ